MGMNGPSENFATQENNESFEFSKEIQAYAAEVVKEMENNPDIAEKVKQDFEEFLLTNAVKDSEAMMDNLYFDMRGKISILEAKVKNGEIHAEEWKQQAKEIIEKTTRLQLYILQKNTKNEED